PCRRCRQYFPPP
ncbi:tRNA synthetases class I (C) catalytic domain protein, partial [Chlamydia psittaci 84-8471/1]